MENATRTKILKSAFGKPAFQKRPCQITPNQKRTAFDLAGDAFGRQACRTHSKMENFLNGGKTHLLI